MSSITEEFKGPNPLPDEDFVAFVDRMKVEGYRDDSLTREQHMKLPEHDWMVCKSWHCFSGNPINKERILKEMEAQRLARIAPLSASAAPPSVIQSQSLFTRAFRYFWG